MGAALAAKAIAVRHKVIFICGKSEVLPPKGVKRVDVTSAAEMFEAVKNNLDGVDIIIGARGRSRFFPAGFSAQKIKKNLIKSRNKTEEKPRYNRILWQT